MYFLFHFNEFFIVKFLSIPSKKNKNRKQFFTFYEKDASVDAALVCKYYEKNVIFLHILFIIPLILWNMYWQESDCFFTAFRHIKRLAGISNNPEANLLGNIILFPLQAWVALLPCSLVTLFIIKNLFQNKSLAIQSPPLFKTFFENI